MHPYAANDTFSVIPITLAASGVQIALASEAQQVLLLLLDVLEYCRRNLYALGIAIGVPLH